MARWEVGSFTTASSVSTHALGITPRVMLSLSGSTAAPNTTGGAIAAVSPGFGTSSFPVGDQFNAPYGAWHTNSSALTSVAAQIGSAWGVRSTDGSVAFRQVPSLGAGATSLNTSAVPTGPLAYAVCGGDELLLSGANQHTISTVASTQASTGYGFQPNAVLLIGNSFASSVANFSFGFACIDSAGTKKQWSIDLTAREGVGAAAYRSASSVSALKLHTSASTAHDVSVTSFRADGLELTVNATDTARAATVSILGLSVPKVDAGKATITTNGAGTGLTGFTVTGLGQNVGLVILASIGTSLQTLQPSNAFSVGFASSNGNQRCVSGYVQTTEETGAGSMSSSRYCSYFGTSHAVIFTSASAANGPLVDDKGTFAVTTDGFKVTFGTTVPNGRNVYWGAFMNVVSDIGGSIQSSFTQNAGLKEVDHIGAVIASSFDASLGLIPEFVPGEGRYHADARFEVRNIQDGSWGLGSGNEEASDRYLTVMHNSSSPDLNKTLDLTTTPQRLGMAEFGNARFLRIVPPSTNTHPLRLAGSPTGQGMQLSSVGESLLSWADRAGSDAFIFTTSTSGVPGVRVLID